jgi:hypothetical protein
VKAIHPLLASNSALSYHNDHPQHASRIRDFFRIEYLRIPQEI